MGASAVSMSRALAKVCNHCVRAVLRALLPLLSTPAAASYYPGSTLQVFFPCLLIMHPFSLAAMRMPYVRHPCCMAFTRSVTSCSVSQPFLAAAAQPCSLSATCCQSIMFLQPLHFACPWPRLSCTPAGAYAFVEFDDSRDAGDAVRKEDGASHLGGRLRVSHVVGALILRAGWAS